jgi:hypothetical protein
MPIIKIILALFACCAIGTGVSFVDAKAMHASAKVYAWILAIILFVALGAML